MVKGVILLILIFCMKSVKVQVKCSSGTMCIAYNIDILLPWIFSLHPPGLGSRNERLYVIA